MIANLLIETKSALLIAAMQPAPDADRTARWEALKARMDDALLDLNLVTAILAAVFGLVAMTYGWKFYRWIVALGGAGFGAASGNILAHSTAEQISATAQYPWLMAIVGGALFGFLAIPYLRLSLFFLFGAIGAYGMYIASQAILPAYSTVFTLAGFFVCGAVSLRFFQLVVVLSTSMLGATSVATAAMWFVKFYQPTAYTTLLQHSYVIPAAVAVIALMGIVTQMQLIPEDGIVPPGGKQQPSPSHSNDAN